MKIKVLRNLGRGLPSYKEGQVVTVDAKEGEALCRRKLAEALPEPPTPPAVIQAVAPPAPIREFRQKPKEKNA